MPAQQRLAATDLLGSEIDERLVVQLELAVDDRLAQIELERSPRLDALVHLGREEAEGAAPVGL